MSDTIKLCWHCETPVECRRHGGCDEATSECVPDSSATSLLPRPEDETPPAAGRPRYPDTRAENARLYEEVAEIRKELQARIDFDLGRGPVSERSERSG